MPAPGLDRFFDPARLVVVSTHDAPAGPDTAAENPDSTPSWRYPGVEHTHVTPAEVGDAPLHPEDLLVVSGDESVQRRVLETLPGSEVNTILLTGGREERGSALESAIRELDARVLGPGAQVRLPAGPSGAPPQDHSVAPRSDRVEDRIAVVTTDPLVAASIEAWAADRGIPLGPVVGTGAELDVGFGEMGAALAEQDSTALVLGRTPVVRSDVVGAFRGVDSETPVAVYPGNGPDLETDAGVAVPGGHVSQELLSQAGMVPVESLERMLDGGPALANQPLPDPASVVVVSNAGGPGVMGIDAVGASGLDVARLTEETIEVLEADVPDHGSAHNPLDLLADSGIDVFEAALDASLEDENVGAAVVLSAPSAIFSFEELAEIIVDARRRHELPIVTALMGGSRTEQPAEILRAAGIPNYFDPYRAVGALDLLGRHAETGPMRYRGAEDRLGFDDERRAELAAVEERVVMQSDEAGDFLEALGVDDVRTVAGDGVEVFLEGIRCPNRGPVVATGVPEFAAAVGDVAVRGVPLARRDAVEMLEGLRAAPVLQGARGREATNTRPVREAILGLSALLERRPALGRVSTSLTLGREGASVDQLIIEPGP